MIEDVQEKSGAAMARQSLTYARRLFGWAAARDLVAVNPCASVRPDDFLPPAVARDRVLTDTELALVLKATAADGVGYPTAPYTRFLLLTACRRRKPPTRHGPSSISRKGHGCCRPRG